ncbi:unnamed protein product [Brassica rapa]|uniref:Uncharacterized protein n=2 Tax=Brassica campestris TaxID=3711 RepID=A0A8D9D6Y5_BRACM|nr:unnamed protein product [Brassica rapa]
MVNVSGKLCGGAMIKTVVVAVVVHLVACVAALIHVGEFPWLEVVVALDHRSFVGEEETGRWWRPMLHRDGYGTDTGRNCMGCGTAKPVVVDAAEVAKMVAKFGRLVEVVVAVLDVGLGSELVAYRHWQTDAVYS